jgi:hypothetical protein
VVETVVAQPRSQPQHVRVVDLNTCEKHWPWTCCEGCRAYFCQTPSLCAMGGGV